MNRSILFSGYLAAMVVVGLLIAVLIVKFCNKNGKFKTDYDERQQIMIGKSYKCAMITAWVLMAVYMIIDMGGNALPMDNSLAIFTILFVSIMVHTSYAVWSDAYFGSNNDYKKFGIMAIVVTAINMAAAVSYYKDGVMVVDGVLTYRFINAECAMMFLLLGVQMLIKGFVDKKKVSDEEDDYEES